MPPRPGSVSRSSIPSGHAGGDASQARWPHPSADPDRDSGRRRRGSERGGRPRADLGREDSERHDCRYLIHGIPFVTEAGFTRSEAALAVAASGAGNLLAKFVWGYTLARYHVRSLPGTCVALLSVGIVAMLAADAANMLQLMLAAFFVWGLGFGGGVPLGEFIWAGYFGRVHIGAVRSVGMPVGIVFGAGGPLVASVLFDATGAYLLAWVGILGLYALGALAVLTSREPPPKVTAAGPAAAATVAR